MGTEHRIHESVVEALETMYALYKKDWIDTEVRLWDRFLGQYDTAVAIAAIEQACESCTYFPKPREVIEIARTINKERHGVSNARQTAAEIEFRQHVLPLIDAGAYGELKTRMKGLDLETKRQICVKIEEHVVRRIGKDRLGEVITKLEEVALERSEGRYGFYLLQYIDDANIVRWFLQGGRLS